MDSFVLAQDDLAQDDLAQDGIMPSKLRQIKIYPI